MNDNDSARMLNEYIGYLYDKKMMDYEYQCERMAPHNMLSDVKIFQDGNQWCCIIGEFPYECIVSFGDTPKKACDEFDRIYYNGEHKEDK